MPECLLTPDIVVAELERLGGVQHTNIVAEKDVASAGMWMHWIVGGRHIRLPLGELADLALSLEDFSVKYCEPAVRVMKGGRGG